MATPATTVKMLAMMERLKTFPSHTLSTPHTKGMISSLAICSSPGTFCQSCRLATHGWRGKDTAMGHMYICHERLTACQPPKQVFSHPQSTAC